MKKYIKVLSVLTVLTMFIGSVFAAENTLYKFVKNADGTYGYDQNSPVKLHNFTNEDVQIPTDFVDNKYQFRSVWIATIANLNIKNTTSEAGFKEEYNKILDLYDEWNMNAMIFQVSPLLDAFYPSQINPWSEFLVGESNGSNVVGKQGTDPGWDPLAWMVEETHKQGLEYHAWFNPYRVTNTKYSTASWQTRLGKTTAEIDLMSDQDLIAALNTAGILADDNYAVLHPDQVYRFDQKLYLDPGIPEVRQRVVDTITEVIENYDVDAIHFDDYFYPYRVGDLYFGTANEDRQTFEDYGLTNGYADTVDGIEKWRRDNVTALVEDVKAAITAENQENHRAVQFGISPFGIWEHQQNDPRGSNTPTSSSMSYSTSIYADTYKWVKEEIVDYINPQIYWSFDQGAAPYGELTKWWASVVEGTNVDLYIGHANYKHVNNGGWEAAWMNPEEIINQLKFNQMYPEITGSVFFSYNDLLKTEITASTEPKYQAKNDAIDLLKEHFGEYQTIIPRKKWLDAIAPEAPQEVTITEDNQIVWKDTSTNDSRYYVVYRIPKTNVKMDVDAKEAIKDPRNIVKKVWRDGDSQTFIDDIEDMENYTYIITALDAAHNESVPVVAQVENTPNPGPNPEPTPEPKPEPTPKPEQPKGTVSNNQNTTTKPKTGQNDNSVMYMALTTSSIVALFALKNYKKRKESN